MAKRRRRLYFLMLTWNSHEYSFEMWGYMLFNYLFLNVRVKYQEQMETDIKICRLWCSKRMCSFYIIRNPITSCFRARSSQYYNSHYRCNICTALTGLDVQGKLFFLSDLHWHCALKVCNLTSETFQKISCFLKYSVHLYKYELVLYLAFERAVFKTRHL